MLLSVVVLVALGVAAGMGATPLLSSNYESHRASGFSLLVTPLQVPLSLPRSSDPRSFVPLHEKNHFLTAVLQRPDLEIPGLKEHMVNVDYAMIEQDNPPTPFFESKYNEDYHLLESRQFEVMLSNPSGIMSICLEEVFSDSESIIKSIRRPLPFCIEPYTKYPLHFNIYVTSVRNREHIKAAIFVNATLTYQGFRVHNRLWLHEVKFNLLPNHLKLYALELRNCKSEVSIVTIKNPEKQELQVMVEYRYKKFFMNNQPFEDKATIAPGKAFRFMIQGKNATMTIYTRNTAQPNKVYPALFLPLHCLEPAVIEHVPIGILTAPNLALSYPLLVSSHSIHNIHIHSIDLISNSQAVELVKMPTNKIIILPNDKHVQVASFIVRSSRYPTHRNSIHINIRYMFSNGTIRGNISRIIFYSQIHLAVYMSENRFYNVTELKETKGELTEAQKLKRFNYTFYNRMQIPIRLQRIQFDRETFKQHYNRHVGGGGYIFPLKMKEEAILQYVGPRQLPVSPARYIATAEFTGGLLIPFEILAYDSTLICVYQGKEDRCSKLKVINFGHQKSQHKNQVQILTVKNLNPVHIKMSLKPYSPPVRNLKLNINIGRPVPDYPHPVTEEKGVSIITLRAGHCINFTFNVQASSNVVTNMKLILETPYEKISTKLKFHFQEGNLTLSPSVTTIPRFDIEHRGQVTLKSTYHEIYTIKEVISSSPCLSFEFDEHQEFKIYEHVKIPFIYRPKREENVTQTCCGEQFIKSRYLLGEEQNPKEIEVQLITSSEIESKAKMVVLPQHTSLLKSKTKDIEQTVMKAEQGSYFCLNISNPYASPLKYMVALLPQTIINKPNDYFTYLRYAKRQKVDAYFCLRRAHSHLLNPALLKKLFRLEENPNELIFKEGGYTDKNPLERTNLSTNDYLNGFTSSGKQTCYKFTTTLYFKLLIESQVINDLLDKYALQVVEKIVQKEHHYTQESNFASIQDDFYTNIKLKKQKYCSFAVYPIFRFCQLIPLKNTMPVPTKNQGKFSARVIPEGEQHQQCYMLSGFRQNEINFQLVIANNHSIYDDYSVTLKLEEPKITVGNIAFEPNATINHGIFIKHYFPDLHQALDKPQILKEHGITNRRKIIPLYFTIEDYDEQFGVFRGNRYFQLSNEGNVDVEFTHFGFQDIENVAIYQGFQFEQLNSEHSGVVLKAHGKATFRIGFMLNDHFKINSTSKLLHHQVTLYFYKGPYFYLQMHLVIKIADNIVAKINAKNEEKNYQNRHNLGYFALNIMSFAFICAVIVQLKKEQQQKENKLELLKEKMKKITVGQTRRNSKDQGQEHKRKNMLQLPPSSIGTKIGFQGEEKFRPQVSISEDDLNFFKTLIIKQKQEKSVIISESSESQHQQLIISHDSERMRLDQIDKSQKSQSGSRSQEPKQEEVPGQERSEFDGQDGSESQYESGSENSLTESYLPDGISVCNDEIQDIDDDMDFQFGFEKQKSLKLEQKHSTGEYKWFESHNPLKRDEPFPWMNTNEKKKNKHKHRKEE